MTKKFIRTVEDFACRNCGAAVRGSGYTNHCPECLWSRHVDYHPGDRAHPCGGMMEPVSVVTARGAERITHRCTACGKRSVARSLPGDDRDALQALA